LRGGSYSQFKIRLGGWVTFAALGIPKDGHFRSFRSFRARCLSLAFARFRHGLFADFREPSARFGSYLRSTCASEAEAWTSGNQGCLLAIDCPAWVHFSFVKVIYVLTVMSYGDTRDPALHSTMMTRLTSKKRPSNQLTRLSGPGEDAEALKSGSESSHPSASTQCGTAHVFGHISPPFVFQTLRLSHMRGSVILHIYHS
jgi:hypothetical protein